MMTYYTATSVLLWLALVVLCVLTREDERLSSSDRLFRYATCVTIGLALLAEWAGVTLSGMPGVPTWAIRLVKCLDYILTPAAGGALMTQMGIRNKVSAALMGVLAINTVLQVVSLFTGWMVTVEPGVGYSHGPLYAVYVAFYVLIIALVIIQFLQYGKSFRRENRLSLYASMGLVVVGILLQEGLGNGVRTAYVGLTLGTAFLHIHSSQFAQQTVDDRLRQQQRQITTDALTGARSRHAYARILDSFSQQRNLPNDLAVFSIDANGLKEVNDGLGHEAGDEMLRGAAECITHVFSQQGACYRIGGDEFVVIAHMNQSQADRALRRLSDETGAWHGEIVSEISLSAGYALATEHPNVTCEELVSIADEAMYDAKAEYYQQSGHDRRRRRRASDGDGSSHGNAPEVDS